MHQPAPRTSRSPTRTRPEATRVQRVTGSRVGFANSSLRITLNVEGEKLNVRTHDYCVPEYWEPASYWALQDAEWKDTLAGRVDVGPLRSDE